MVSDILQCDHVSKAKQYLNIHNQIKHGSVRYSCFICDFLARSRVKLTAHKQAKHEGLRFYCNQCEFKTLTKSYLKILDGINFTCSKSEIQLSTSRVLYIHATSVGIIK